VKLPISRNRSQSLSGQLNGEQGAPYPGDHSNRNEVAGTESRFYGRTIHRNRRKPDMTTQEIERTCNGSQSVALTTPELRRADLGLGKIFYPLGFPVEVKTNASEVLDILDTLWGRFEQTQNTIPILSEVCVVPGDSIECPPLPVYRLTPSLFISIADRDNYSIVDMERNSAEIWLSRAALRHRRYAGYYFLGSPISSIATRYTTPIHGGCVALDGRGVLLCGDSGAGKSTLSYACARSGWTYVSDDGSYLLNSSLDRIATGNCHQVRFRPSAADFFPEIEGLRMMPRAAGKPSVEMQTAMIPQLLCAQTAKVDFIVFLNRRAEGRARLASYSKDMARTYLQQGLFGPENSRGPQLETIERLLSAEVFELRYRDLSWAVSRLQQMVRERL
jgi:hypothetical protein